MLLQRTKQWGLQEKNGVLDGAKWLITLPFGIGAAIAGAAYALTVVAGVAFTLSWILYREKSEEPTETVQEIPEAEKNDDTTSVENMDSKQDGKAVYSPLEGKLIPMTEVPDETFASKALGDGVAVIPEKGCVYAPFDGEVEMVYDTGHAIGLVREDGMEVLIHVGINTVELGDRIITG